MLRRVFFALSLTLSFIIGFSMESSQAASSNPNNQMYIELKDGTVEIELLPHLAPNHVLRIRELVRDGFYDGIVFHRVIDGFMAQTGDPTGTGTGGSGKNLEAEFSEEPHVRGVLSMARANDPDSADSQFFIVFDDARFLDTKYTVFGRVVKGMEFVDNIKKGDTSSNGMVEDPDKMIRVYLGDSLKEDSNESGENEE